MTERKKNSTQARRPHMIKLAEPLPGPLFRPFDPEMLFVECGRCGAPVLWEPGKTTRLLDEAGIDPLELDASCVLVTSGCPMCSAGQGPFTVRIFRIAAAGTMLPLPCANA